ncbi:Rhodanese-related sulfurtransferase [Lactobacillus equicursoris 66c]|uniref:Rhodanese-related sulfurtransferase n=1 Tax=Lactobacillus equicursoris 66c TaxID=872326 RepID=K0NRT7_9LACO|nr:rhodanese-like domain-containing protein [Lactobacillus equicursoris]CCK83576.1 Rhodanese-related sulfurtransferase [Lactobacillus equicursoris 66c]CCK83788.1 Rhodanese-related sulfurtransferase [Lactobacillus equicursoris 66c]
MKEITTKELADLLAAKDIKLIDIRTPIEYLAGHIKEAKNFPLEEINSFDLPKSDRYYLICRSGNRSGQAAAILSQKGYTDLVNVQGGMLDWDGATINDL